MLAPLSAFCKRIRYRVGSAARVVVVEVPVVGVVVVLFVTVVV
jgi:hypothetical protein